MRVLICGLVGVSILGGLASAAEAGSLAKKYRDQAPERRAIEHGNGYHERLADKLPFGSSIWWEQMMRERRGGRPG